MSVSAQNLLRLLGLLHTMTDADHPMALGEIVRQLNSGADKVSVRTVRRALDDIGACLEELEYEERRRVVFDRAAGACREEIVRTNYYLTHAFTDGELRFLMDQVQFSQQIPGRQRADLLEKLKALGSSYFRMRRLLPSRPVCQENQQLFLNVELVEEAVQSKKRIALTYLGYDIHRKLTVRLDQNGKPRLHILSPYSLAAMDGRYYLICNNDRFDSLSHYRIDRMHDIRILDTPVRPFSELQISCGNDFDLETYWQQHAYMMAGDHVRAVLHVDHSRIDCLLDTFHGQAELTEKDGILQATVRAGRKALLRFIRIHSPQVEVLAPREFRREAADSLKAALAVYANDSSGV